FSINFIKYTLYLAVFNFIVNIVPSLDSNQRRVRLAGFRQITWFWAKDIAILWTIGEQICL
ncbi:TPA: hypothetical protein ACT9MQ_002549, partial [Legionella pneumophila]